jgi:aspartokinase-like uncharacterized kinase
MDAVIKVGGSLAEGPAVLKRLCRKLSEIGKQYRVTAVPGGGVFADVVRGLDRRFALSAGTAHRMAMLGMDQYGFLLSELIPCSCIVHSLDDAAKFSDAKKVPVLLPSRLIIQEGLLDASWDVTSDSIAAHLAHRLNAAKLILVTDVDGIFTADPKKHSDSESIKEISAVALVSLDERTSVDRCLPRLLLDTPMDCFVVNGRYPQRIKRIMSGQPTVCTKITAK